MWGRLKVLGLFSREKAEGDLGNVDTYLIEGVKNLEPDPSQ